MKNIITLDVKEMWYDNNELHLETKDSVYCVRDKRVLYILADRLAVLKTIIQDEAKP